MSRLERFVAVMREQAAESIRLAPGQPISLRKNGLVRPMTKDPLTDAQIIGLLREIAPPELADRLGHGTSFAFTWETTGGAIEVQVEPETNGASAVLRSLFAPVAKVAPPPPVDPAAARELDLGAPRARIERLFKIMTERGASDLHLRTGGPPILRHDGHLVALEEPPLPAEEIELMIRSIMSASDFASWKEILDADFAHEIAGVGRFRCNAGRDRAGPMAVFRVIPAKIKSTAELGLSAEVQALCQLTKGLVLVTGPTGSGKSTTLAAMVDLVNSTRQDHILTIEDPIEFVHQSKKAIITQRQIGMHTRTFKSALRAALREDPDVILVGELRDLETIAIAIETAETGHLVFGTLHTTTAASTVDRIIDQFPADRQSQIRVMLSESLRGVIAQTLCRKQGGGRVAAYEVLLSTPAVANLIREGKSFQIPSVMQTNRRIGMVTMNDALVELVEQKLIDAKEAFVRAVDKPSLLIMLKSKGVNTSALTEG